MWCMPRSFWKASVTVAQLYLTMCFAEKVSCFSSWCHEFTIFKVSCNPALVQELDIWHKVGEDKRSSLLTEVATKVS